MVQDYLQMSNVSVEDSVSPLTISSVYFPPRHTVKQEQFEDSYNTIRLDFITGGDYNAKHTNWVSRLISSKDVNYPK
jgi:hypothetical protein